MHVKGPRIRGFVSYDFVSALIIPLESLPAAGRLDSSTPFRLSESALQGESLTEAENSISHYINEWRC